MTVQSLPFWVCGKGQPATSLTKAGEFSLPPWDAKEAAVCPRQTPLIDQESGVRGCEKPAGWVGAEAGDSRERRMGPPSSCISCRTVSGVPGPDGGPGQGCAAEGGTPTESEDGFLEGNLINLSKDTSRPPDSVGKQERRNPVLGTTVLRGSGAFDPPPGAPGRVTPRHQLHTRFSMPAGLTRADFAPRGLQAVSGHIWLSQLQWWESAMQPGEHRHGCWGAAWGQGQSPQRRSSDPKCQCAEVEKPCGSIMEPPPSFS